ncbi:unnamed protein product [Albugo candida]|uniref:Uncharacterized protein n=1 Tax=Albugo candida TaxID=65357 RepID=A0A024FYD0_9STRA|nr:unnamed protein product [Albugo candida]|eukprot:CCI11679.1 unnamed protein product [Albugo candida]
MTTLWIVFQCIHCKAIESGAIWTLSVKFSTVDPLWKQIIGADDSKHPRRLIASCEKLWDTAPDQIVSVDFDSESDKNKPPTGSQKTSIFPSLCITKFTSCLTSSIRKNGNGIRIRTHLST